MNDIVNHPKHYKVGGIETIDFIEAKLTPEAFQGYLLGNVIKYVSRCEYKLDKLADLQKANWYLKHLISTINKKKDKEIMLHEN